MARVYPREYLRRREAEVDRTEWLDIYWALRALGVPRDEYIVDLGAGTGGLVRFLRSRGYERVWGLDLLHEDEYVRRVDLTREYPEPRIYACVSQHFFEHIPQERAVELLRYCLEEGVLAVFIVPGHYTGDPTHVIDHYEYEDLLGLVEQVKPQAYRIEPDTMSYINPAARDWLVVMASYEPLPGSLKPLPVALGLWFLRCMARFAWRGVL